ncbi:hypothetical protein AGIG_G15897 [Arapaima gigas]
MKSPVEDSKTNTAVTTESARAAEGKHLAQEVAFEPECFKSWNLRSHTPWQLLYCWSKLIFQQRPAQQPPFPNTPRQIHNGYTRRQAVQWMVGWFSGLSNLLVHRTDYITTQPCHSLSACQCRDYR